MKKILIALSVLFVMSGCGENTDNLSCTSSTTNNGITTRTTYDVDYLGDDVKHVTITYDYSQDNNQNGTNNADDIDGVNADTDGIDQNDTNNNNADLESDDVVDGLVGDAIDETIDGVTDTILDIAGIRNRYENQLATYDNIEGFSYEVDVDSDNEYKVIYEIDMDKISDADVATFNIGRNFSDVKTNYENNGYTCQ